MEDGPVWLRHYVAQDVQSATVRHAERDLAGAELAADLDDLLERGDQRFAAVEAETLGAYELHGAEALEAFGFDQLVEDRLLALGRELVLLVGAFHALLEPGLLFGIRDVHELDADASAIGAAQDFEHLAHGGGFETQHAVDENGPVEIVGAEAVTGRVEFRVTCGRREPEGVEVSLERSAHPIGPDHLDGAHGVYDSASDFIRG